MIIYRRPPSVVQIPRVTARAHVQRQRSDHSGQLEAALLHRPRRQDVPARAQLPAHGPPLSPLPLPRARPALRGSDLLRDRSDVGGDRTASARRQRCRVVRCSCETRPGCERLRLRGGARQPGTRRARFSERRADAGGRTVPRVERRADRLPRRRHVEHGQPLRAALSAQRLLQTELAAGITAARLFRLQRARVERRRSGGTAVQRVPAVSAAQRTVVVSDVTASGRLRSNLKDAPSGR